MTEHQHDRARACKIRYGELGQLLMVLGILDEDYLDALARRGSRKQGYHCSALARLIGLLEDSLPLITVDDLGPKLVMSADLRNRLFAKLVYLVAAAQEVNE